MKDNLSKKVATIMRNNYAATFCKHGPTPEGVDWGKNHKNAELRLKKMGELILQPVTGKISVLDVGCGYGTFYEHLQNQLAGNFQYTGIDLCGDMIRAAKRQHPKATWLIDDFMAHNFGQKKFDYIICNGIFTQKFTTSTLEMAEYFKLFVAKLNKLSRRGFAFNVMSSYVNFRVDNLYYVNPAEMLSYLLTKVGRNVRLDHTYGLYEYSCYVYK